MDKLEKIASYFNEEHHYQTGIEALRTIALSTPVEETYKWQFPTYTINSKNIFAICKFKSHFGIWFFNGVFLNDPFNVLENAQEGKTKAMRHWKFKAIEDIDKKLVLAYIKEAIENQKQGKVLVASKKKAKQLEIPLLLAEALSKDEKSKTAFGKLSTYKQNEYCEYIQTAKQEKTKINRLEKSITLIKQGIGLNDKYKNY